MVPNAVLGESIVLQLEYDGARDAKRFHTCSANFHQFAEAFTAFYVSNLAVVQFVRISDPSQIHPIHPRSTPKKKCSFNVAPLTVTDRWWYEKRIPFEQILRFDNVDTYFGAKISLWHSGERAKRSCERKSELPETTPCAASLMPSLCQRLVPATDRLTRRSRTCNLRASTMEKHV